MAIFHLTDWNLGFKSKREEGLKMSISMRRKITSELMTTYFPSLLLTTITFATTFFKPFFFEAALSVNLTTMLVMTTIFISKMESLPPTSDIKMIDIWLILCQMVPFAEVILLTAMEYNREDNKKLRKGKIKGRRKMKTKNRATTSLTVIPLNGQEPVDKPNGGRLISKCIIPSLKTLGKIVLDQLQYKSVLFCREEGLTSSCDHQLHHLLWNCIGFLQSVLISHQECKKV